MHDLDRTLRELETGMDGFEMGMDALESSDSEYELEGGYDGEFEMEYDGEFEGGYDPEFDQEYDGEYDQEWDGEMDPEAVFDEIEEMELAAELMEVGDQQELDQFLGRVVRRAAQHLGRRVGAAVRRSPVGAVHRVLRDTASAALPGLRQAARGALPAFGGGVGDLLVPGGRGRAGGEQIAGGVGTLVGLELEGMSPEDQEFEISRAFVRLAGDAVRRAAQAGYSAPARKAARRAVVAAARQHAPGLVPLITRGRRGRGGRGRSGGGAMGAGGAVGGATGGGAAIAGEMGGPWMRSGMVGGGMGGGSGSSGRWVRRGGTIVLLGI